MHFGFSSDTLNMRQGRDELCILCYYARGSQATSIETNFSVTSRCSVRQHTQDVSTKRYFLVNVHFSQEELKHTLPIWISAKSWNPSTRVFQTMIFEALVCGDTIWAFMLRVQISKLPWARLLQLLAGRLFFHSVNQPLL